MNVPAHTRRPIGRGLLFAAVNRRTVDASRKIDQIAVVVRIVGVEVGARRTNDGLIARRTGVGFVLHGIGDIVERIVHEPRNDIPVGLVSDFAQVAADHRLDQMPVELLGIGDHQFAGKRHVRTVVQRILTPRVKHAGIVHIVVVIADIGIAHGRQIDVRAVEIAAHRKVAAHFQPGNDRPVDRRVVRDIGHVAVCETAQVFRLVNGRELRRRNRKVHSLRSHVVKRQRTIIGAVSILFPVIGKRFRVTGERSVRRLVAPGDGELQIVGDSQARMRIDQFRAGPVGRSARFLHHTVVLPERQIDLITHVPLIGAQPVDAALDDDRMTVLQAHAQRLRKPIGIDARKDLLADQIVGVEIIAAVLPFASGIEQPGQTLEFQCLRSVHQFVRRQVGNVHAARKRIAHPERSGFGAFGLDHDHAIGRAGAVYGRCRRIFEYRYALDAVHVQVIYLLHLDLEAVENEDRQAGHRFQRAARDLGETVLSADLDLLGDIVRVGTEHPAHIHDLERRIENFQGVEETVVVHRPQFIALHEHGRSREAVLRLGHVSRNDRSRDIVHLGFEIDIERALVIHLDRLFFHAHARHDDRHAPRRQRQAEAPLLIGRSTVVPGIFLHDRSISDRILVLVEYRSRDYESGRPTIGRRGGFLAGGGDHDRPVDDVVTQSHRCAELIQRRAQFDTRHVEADLAAVIHILIHIEHLIARRLLNCLKDLAQRSVSHVDRDILRPDQTRSQHYDRYKQQTHDTLCNSLLHFFRICSHDDF